MSITLGIFAVILAITLAITYWAARRTSTTSEFFCAANKLTAAQNGFAIPRDTTVEASVGVGSVPQGLGIEVELRISLPGLSRAEADSLVEKSHALCPYSNATRGNVSVRLVLV